MSFWVYNKNLEFMAILIDGRKIKTEILENVANQVKSLPFVPVFCDILVGEDKTSASYVRIKAKNANSVGIKFRTVELPQNITTESLIEEIENLNKVPHMCGVIVQLPLPPHIDRKRVLNTIDSRLDVDCLSEINSKNFYSGSNDSLSYPTALACMKILDSLKLRLEGKNILVLGQGMLVGKPVSYLIRERGLYVKTADRSTEDILTLIKDADIIISAMGKGKFITGSMVKDNVIIIDAGTSEENGAIIGDVDMESVESVASYVTPSPGGVGPVTVAMLISNILKVALSKK